MKLKTGELAEFKWNVAPRTGAWVETLIRRFAISKYLVAPRTGAWVETSNRSELYTTLGVAPRTGAWVETNTELRNVSLTLRRAPHGRVG